MLADVPSVVAAGVNCLAPGGVTAAVRAAAASGRPVVAYPNSGESWDARERAWTGDPRLSASDVQRSGSTAVRGRRRLLPGRTRAARRPRLATARSPCRPGRVSPAPLRA